jgi:hypothetical protein
MTRTAILRLASPFIMAAAVLGVYAALFGWQRPVPAPRVAEDPVPYRNCAYPRNEGELTVMTVLDGKLICWRMK